MWEGRPTLPIVLGWVLTCHLPGKLGARPRERCFLLDLQTYCYSSNRSAVVWSPRCVLGTGGRMLPATQGSRWSQNQHVQNYRPSWVFPGSPVVRTLSFPCRGPKLIPMRHTQVKHILFQLLQHSALTSTLGQITPVPADLLVSTTK